MNITSTKLELAKQLLATTDRALINHLKAVFETQNNNWFKELPAEIQMSVSRGLEQSEKNQSIPHDKARKIYKKWLKK